LKSHSHTKRGRDEPLKEYLKKLTHLYLSEKGIDEIDNLQLCKNLSVLYLYDNNISRIKNLDSATNLTHLYLQNNRITKIEGLSGLKRLTKLYLGHNAITVIEGMASLESLQELHVEHQILPPGEKLLFEPRSLIALAQSLNVFNISGNNIDEIIELRCLENLTQFMCEDNLLVDMKDMAKVLKCWPNLWRLELTGNPLCEKKKYRDRVLVMSKTLVMLDGKEVSATAKKFLMNWKANRDARRRLHKQQQLQIESGNTKINGMEAITHPLYTTSSSSGYVVNPGMNPEFHHGIPGPNPLQPLPFPRKQLSVVLQARAPHSTLLRTRGNAEERAKLRFPNIFSPPRRVMTEPGWENDEKPSVPPLRKSYTLPLQAVEY